MNYTENGLRLPESADNFNIEDMNFNTVEISAKLNNLNAIKGYNETTLTKYLYKTEEHLNQGEVINDVLLSSSLPGIPVLLSNGNIMFVGENKVTIANKEGTIINEKTHSTTSPSYPNAVYYDEKVYYFWVTYTNKVFYIYYKTFDNNGNILTDTTQIKYYSSSNYSGYGFSVIIDKNGDAIILFHYITSTYYCYLLKYNFETGQVTTQTISSYSDGYNYHYPTSLGICKTNENEFCTFIMKGTRYFYYQVWDTDTFTMTKERIITTGFNIYSFKCCYYKDNQIAMVYTSKNVDNSNYSYYMRLLNVETETSSVISIGSTPKNILVCNFGVEYLATVKDSKISFYSITSGSLTLSHYIDFNLSNTETPVQIVCFNMQNNVVRFLANTSKFDVKTGLKEYYQNRFETQNIQNTFQNGEILKILTPTSVTSTDVYSNTINNFSIDTLLKASKYYELVYKNNKFYAKEVRV